jgi:hypothetical protein
MSQQTGRVTIKLDGEPLRSKPGAKMQLGGVQRKYSVTDQGETIFQEELVPAEMSCTMPHLSDTDVERIRDFKNGTCQYVTDTGVTYTMAKAGYAKSGDLSNGELDVTFQGAPVKGG